MSLSALIIGLALAAGVANSSDSGLSGPFKPCKDTSAVRVAGASGTDFADVCQGALTAIRFFETHGVVCNGPIRIEVSRERPAQASSSASGWYLEEERVGHVVPYTLFRSQRTWFGVPIERGLYRVMAAHEAAHAITHANFRTPVPTIQAKEYLAYVVAFAAMPPELRSRALRATPTEGFEDIGRFTPLLYMFDPMRFGAEAHRHFSSRPDPAWLIESILAGELLQD